MVCRKSEISRNQDQIVEYLVILFSLKSPKFVNYLKFNTHGNILKICYF